MKAVLISIRPKYVEKICSKIKTIEVRKTRPKIDTPFKVYIYCTYGNARENYSVGKRGKVIGEFTCDKITDISVVVRNCNEDYNHVYHNDECKGSCLTWKELQEYGKGKPLYGWHISDLVIYDKPRELSEFKTPTDCKSEIAKAGLCNTCCLSACFCSKKPKRITRPPQSWCYVEEN